METLKTLIQTLSLDHSFFYHLILALILYFISKKWLFQPYIAKMDERSRLTKGRMDTNEEKKLEIEKKKELYEEKAKNIHKEFQKLFSVMKNKAMENFSKESLKLEKDQKTFLDEQKKNLVENAKKQNEILEKSLPQLKESLLGKIKS
ncbi:MAG: hypothetical protein OXC37_04825 [Bdellovibrionaceae bacterium]|nr:hypothetical protein [Pseudobdellovibrionaceae bacterium]